MDEPTLSCGHALSEVVDDPEGTLYCRACEREAVIDGPDEGCEERQVSEADGSADQLPQPAFGKRGSEPGPRGCWGVNNRGEPCGSFVTRDSDYCSAHRGLGLGRDPRGYSQVGHAARRRQLAARAQLRMVMGDRGRIGPRTLLREEVNRNAQRLVGRAVGAALNPETDDAKAAGIAMRLIETADPPAQATLEISGPLTEDALKEMSLSQLIAYADAQGIDWRTRPEDDPTPPEPARVDPARLGLSPPAQPA
jgi:hypothetical protein